jgi:16S rRNA (uracil1498-N3)-methyltransferase
MNLLLLEPREVAGGGDVALSDIRAAHLLKVLRVTPGQTVRVGLLDGPLGIGEVRSAGEGRVALHCTFETAVPPLPPVDVLLALPRPKVMRRLWPQLAALGVGHIMLTNAARVERNYFDAHVLAPDRYRPLLIEGLQQARDTRLPRVTIHRRLKVLVEDELDSVFADGVRLVADPAAAASSMEIARSGREDRALLAIGPEGGWNDFERGLLAAHGFRPVSLGPRTLRTDTACIALVALVHDALGHSETLG